MITIRDTAGPTLGELAEQFPQDYQKALLDLGSHLRKEISSQLRAGQVAGGALAPLNPLTLQLKAAEQGQIRSERKKFRMSGGASGSRAAKALSNRMKWSKGYGGRLPDAVNYQIEPGKLRVGFLKPDSLVSSAAKWQSTRAGQMLTKGMHRMLRVALGKDFHQPGTLDSKPQRDTITPYIDLFSKEADDVIHKSLEARLNRRLTRVYA